MVVTGEYERITKRSPERATTDPSRRSWAMAGSSGTTSSTPKSATRAMTSTVPRCTRTLWPASSRHPLSSSARNSTVSIIDGDQLSSLTSTSPRAIMPRRTATPVRARAVRCPATALSSGAPCT